MPSNNEGSPSSLRLGHDVNLRFERVRLFFAIVSRCDNLVARAAQTIREAAGTFSDVAQSYYEVSLCVNNVNPATASILRSGRTTGDDVDVTVGGGGTKPGNVYVSRHRGTNEISYRDGVVANYGASLQSAAKLFVSESRSLKDGGQSSDYSKGVHEGVLAKLMEVRSAAKEAVDDGREAVKLLKKFERCQKIVERKVKKYERAHKPLSMSKRYPKQFAQMTRAEELFNAKLASFDAKYEHLFEHKLYVMGHSLDNFLRVNCTFMTGMTEMLHGLAPPAEAAGQRPVGRGGGEAPRGAAVRDDGYGRGGVVPNFSSYFEIRRDEPSQCMSTPDRADDGEAAPLTARNEEVGRAPAVDPTPPDSPPRKPLAMEGRGAGVAVVKTNAAAPALAPTLTGNSRASASAVARAPAAREPPRTSTLRPTTMNEPPPPPSTAGVAAGLRSASHRAPYGDTPSVVDHARRTASPPARAVAGEECGVPNPLLAARPRDFSPSCEPCGHEALTGAAPAASVARTAPSLTGSPGQTPPQVVATIERRPPPPPATAAAVSTGGPREASGDGGADRDSAGGGGEAPGVRRCIFPARSSRAGRRAGRRPVAARPTRPTPTPAPQRVPTPAAATCTGPPCPPVTPTPPPAAGTGGGRTHAVSAPPPESDSESEVVAAEGGRAVMGAAVSILSSPAASTASGGVGGVAHILAGSGGIVAAASPATPQARQTLSPGSRSASEAAPPGSNLLPCESSAGDLSMSGTQGRPTVAAAVYGNGSGAFRFLLDTPADGRGGADPLPAAAVESPASNEPPQRRGVHGDPCALSSAASLSGGATPPPTGGFSGASTPVPHAGVGGGGDGDLCTAAWDEVHLAKPAGDHSSHA